MKRVLVLGALVAAQRNGGGHDAVSCHGNGPDHCCYVRGDPCPFLEVNTIPGRRWVCGLRRELGSWDAVHRDSRYLAEVRPAWDESGTVDCGDFCGFNRAGDGEPQCCFAEAD